MNAASFTVRLATLGDVEQLRGLIERSVRGLQAGDYTAAQIDLALDKVYGVDTQLIRDGTYFVVEAALDAALTDPPVGGAVSSRIVGCGGWSRRRTLYGGDQFAHREATLLDPAQDAAKIRAFFVEPDWARRGIGSLILEACEQAAFEAGFTRLEMGATLTGVPFYRARGYRECDRHAVPLPQGESLAIVRMEKTRERSGMTPSARIRRFHELHDSGCFVIPNPWDPGSARLLAQLGFQALATTSSGIAWSLARQDNHISLDTSLAHLRSIAAAVDVPVNADFEGGFAIDPAGVARNVAAAVGTGIAGLSIEDSTGDPAAPLFDIALAIDRVRAARRAIDASGTGVLLTGRSEGFIVGRPDLAETIRRLTAYAEAGADCLYAPGIRSNAEIQAVVAAVSPKPVNVLVGSAFTTVAKLKDLGVRRISVGGALARVAWTGFLRAAQEIADRGTFEACGDAISFDDIERRFTAP